MNTLYFLQISEKAAFDRLPDALKEGWKIATSAGGKTGDTPERCLLRASLIRLHDPVLRNFLDKAKTCNTEKELAVLFSRIDLGSVHPDDLLELVFALGPDALSGIILQLLTSAKTDQDVLGIAALSFLREELFAASAAS